MAITINGNGTIGGLTAGGLPDGTVTRDDLATTAKGSILQVVQDVKSAFFSTVTTIPLDDTIPQITEGAEFLSASITPNATSSKILVRVVANVANSSISFINFIALFRGTGASAIATSWSRTVVGNNPTSPMVIEFLDSPSTASSVTYTVRGAGAGGTFQVNGASAARYAGGSLNTTLTLIEVAA